jgi:AraC-like DNA-binding protein
MRPTRTPRRAAAPVDSTSIDDEGGWLLLALIEHLCLALGERHDASPDALASALKCYSRELRRRAADELGLVLLERLAARARGARMH